MSVASEDDLREDLRGSQHRAALWTTISTYVPSFRDVAIVGRNSPGKTAQAETPLIPCEFPGRRLIAGCSLEKRLRYRTLLYLESRFDRQFDHACLIAAACQILEQELSDLVMTPAVKIAGLLIGALHAGGKNKQAELLDGWSQGRLPATIGTASLIVLGLRYALNSEDVDCQNGCRAFLAERFREKYLNLIADKQFGATLDRIREKFRNPACHGHEQFDQPQYAQFARLLVGRNQIVTWNEQGPQDDNLPDAALLHHHLASARVIPRVIPVEAQWSPLERLVNLARSRPEGFAIEITPRTIAFSDAPAVPAHQPPARYVSGDFQIGKAIQFQIESDRNAEIGLINVGTSGKATVLLPNAWQPQVHVAAGQPLLMPDPTISEFDFVPGQPAGRERILAIASTQSLPVVLQPAGDDVFRVLGDDEMLALADRLEAQSPGSWSACLAEFEVVDQHSA